MTLPPRLRAVLDAVARWGPVVTAGRIGTVYETAGGGLLAGGLTYSALFALLPALLLVAGILGFVVDDAGRRRAIVEGIGQSLPPLQGFLEASLTQLTEGAAGFGLLGLIGLAWGASRFYGSLDDAFARIFEDAPVRNLLVRTVRGLGSVVLLVMTFLATLALTGVSSYLAEQTGDPLGMTAFWQIASPVAAGIVFVAATALIYRVVPAREVAWRAVVPPALVIGIAMALLTQLFSFVAPRIIGSAVVYGTFVALFAAMIWLSFGFQLLLLGAAWVRVRSG